MVNRFAEGQGAAQESMIASESEEMVFSRRLLLSSAASGLVLTATGLILPEWALEAEAREGVLGGDKGGRRGKNRRGRDRKRSQNQKKNKGKDNAPRGGGSLFRATALTVVNKSAKPLDCTFFYQVKTGLDDYALPTANGTQIVAPNQSYRYNPDRYRVGVLIKQVLGTADIYVDVRNVSFWYPRGGVSQGNNLNPQGGNFGEPFIAEQLYIETEAKWNQNVSLQRLRDDVRGQKRIEWELEISES